jgi:hypothetical protein
MKLSDAVRLSHEVRQWVRQIPQVKQIINNVSEIVDGLQKKPIDIKSKSDYGKK